MMKIKEIQERLRDLACSKSKQFGFEVKDTPEKTLWSINFNVPYQDFVDQQEMAQANLELDGKSCLGRVAQAAAIVENYFPDTDLQLAEVRKDRLAEMMLGMLAESPEKKYDPSFISELLMYEEPHMVLLVDGRQFEPLSLQLGQDIQHPRIEVFPVWEGITASSLTSYAWLEREAESKLEILQEAEKLCPGTTLVSENMCESLEVFGRRKELLEKVAWCVQERPCARNLYVMYALTGDKNYYDHLVK